MTQQLREDRRPKLPSLEEKALKELDYIETNDFYLDANVSIIRRSIADLLSRIEDLERRLDKQEEYAQEQN